MKKQCIINLIGVLVVNYLVYICSYYNVYFAEHENKTVKNEKLPKAGGSIKINGTYLSRIIAKLL